MEYCGFKLLCTTIKIDANDFSSIAKLYCGKLSHYGAGRRH